MASTRRWRFAALELATGNFLGRGAEGYEQLAGTSASQGRGRFFRDGPPEPESSFWTGAGMSGGTKGALAVVM
ncbi:hypothetical protein BU26DRAFT_525243 [Trematosphaeria pertusa]|uniref:Uncharacterized protein n=1 Tax=Trematosphaeria pertusa TaxID=390896 RepID=A0A6A6HU26_9PLEO|nr:uncharacterized protein BU26DRAFT_525243 [Trematosphaeria pertusa]KAF2241419.1 hypothetical protein BU26DRAFT_525243 [Trematosphaeria pertusa]